ncbi:MAG: MipA/OmpV family protein [Rhodoferax sp.]|nr:MipA/OmpV family protein [Rhodoferax sp.]
MKKRVLQGVGVIAFTVSMSVSAQAQIEPLPLWEVGVFAGTATTPAYPGSADRASRSLALPIFIYRGEVLRIERGDVGARLFRSEDIELDVGFSASLPASSDDIAARKGMSDLGTLVEFGPRVKITLARPAPGTRVRLELPLRAVLEFNNGVRQQGYAFEPELGLEMRDVGAGWSLSATASVVFGDKDLNTYFYGVTTPYATAARPAYDAQAGLITTRLGLSMAKSLSPDVRVFGYVRHELMEGAANKASPLFQQTTGTSVGLGLLWTLARSEQRAAAR